MKTPEEAAKEAEDRWNRCEEGFLYVIIAKAIRERDEHWQARTTTCCWCFVPLADLAALKAHSAACEKHPLKVQRDALVAELTRLADESFKEADARGSAGDNIVAIQCYSRGEAYRHAASLAATKEETS